MKKIVLTFGLLSGAIMAVLMTANVSFVSRAGFDKGILIGYTTMVAAFMLVFFAIRSYRDNVGGGTISFGRGVAIGLLIMVIANVCYAAAWEVVGSKYFPDFIEKYQAYELDKARAAGKSEAELAKMRAEGAKFAESYKNPVYRAAMTFVEPLPVGLVITLVSAGILRRRRRGGDTVLAAA